jgi:serine/threonine-protein kinase
VNAYPRQYGKYVLLEPIGAGGMSEVDLAHRGVDDTSFVRFVAIKRVAHSNVADESFVRMFMDEARINAELHHGNIVGVYDFGKQVDPVTGREEYFMVMEYVPGLDLRGLQRAAHALGHRLPLRFCFSVLHEVLQGLQYAHSKVDTLGRPMNLVHRDINPRNVMVSVRGEVKVIDFGVALAEDRLEKTQGRSLKGKFAYMSPEQIEGNVSLDGRTDLYAVGLMLHELVSGVGPFHGLTELQIMHRIVMGQIPSLQVPPEFPDGELLQGLHARALARDRDERYADARSFRKDLERAAERVGGLATQEERAALVSSLAPQQVEGIASRLRGYHESSHSVSRSVARVAPPGPPDSSGATLGGAQITQELEGHTQALPGEPYPPAPGQDAGRNKVLWLGLLVAALLAGVVLVFGGGGMLLLLKEPSSNNMGSGQPGLDELGLGGVAEPLPNPEPSPGDGSGPERATGAADGAVSRPPPSDPGSAGTRPAATSQPSGHPQGSGSDRASTSAGSGSQPVSSSSGSAGEPSGASEPGSPGAGSAQPTPEPTPTPTHEPEPTPTPEPEPTPTPEPEPTPEPPPPKEGPQGRLLVNSTPRSLQVTVDGVAVGVTPYQGEHTLGSHRVVVHGPGGQVCEKQATVVSSKPVLSTCTFEGQQGESQNDDSRRRR